MEHGRSGFSDETSFGGMDDAYIIRRKIWSTEHGRSGFSDERVYPRNGLRGCEEIKMEEEKMIKPDCIFCKIANGEIPTNKVYEDESFVAILDASPATRGHSLVIPKNHYTDLFEMSGDEAAEAMKRVHKVAGILKEKLNADGMNLLQNNGEVAGQTVHHFHMHLIPRYLSDPKDISFTKQKNADPDDIAKILKAIND